MSPVEGAPGTYRALNGTLVLVLSVVVAESPGAKGDVEGSAPPIEGAPVLGPTDETPALAPGEDGPAVAPGEDGPAVAPGDGPAVAPGEDSGVLCSGSAPGEKGTACAVASTGRVTSGADEGGSAARGSCMHSSMYWATMSRRCVQQGSGTEIDERTWPRTCAQTPSSHT